MTEDNFQLIDEELLDFAEINNLKDLRVDIDVIHMLRIPVEIAAEKLLKLKASAISRGINLTGFWERAAENLSTSILEKHIAFCGGAAGRSLCVSPQGDAFICGYSAERYAGLSSEEIKNSSIYEKIVSGRLAGNIKRCEGCILEGQCIGGCHITEEYSRLGDRAAIDYNCFL
jgi:radical SAM protein with 4Fe4S-binding SPASM domain